MNDSAMGLAAGLEYETRLYIDGAFTGAGDAGQYAVIDPATEAVIAHVANATIADTDRAVRAAKAALQGGDWARLGGSMRARLLLRLAELIERDTEMLVAMEARDTGMPPGFARAASVGRAAAFLRYNAGWSDKLFGETIPLDNPGQMAMTIREPVGVVGGIISWNVPLVNAVGKLAPALAAGCSLVLKTSGQAPLTALHLARLVHEAGFPPGAFNLLTGEGARVPKAMVEHPMIDMIAFTGSTATGKAIMAAAAPTMKRVTLELGGKSPVIVLPDADIDRAAAAAAAGIFANAGQVCIAGSRLYVHRDIADAMIDRLKARADDLRVGAEPDSEMGPLISGEQRERVLAFLDAARADGMHMLAGGDTPDRTGYFIRPTIIAGEVEKASVLHEEVFGPVLCVTIFDEHDLARIAEQVNATPYGLSANVWTRDISKALTLTRMIRAGTVRINGGPGYDAAIPFGGFKQSGIGRENGSEGVRAFTELKAVTIAL